MRATTLCLICCLATVRFAAADELADAPRRDRSPVKRQAAAVEQAAFVESPGDSSGANPKSPKSAAPRLLRPRGAGKTADNEGQAPRARPLNATSSALTSVMSLAVVLGLFFAVVWAMRRGMPQGPALLPREAVEVLGRTPLAGRQHAHLIRCGNKLLLVYLSQGAAETLAEITDPMEVDRLVGLCRQAHPQSTTASFRQILQQFGREKRAGGA